MELLPIIYWSLLGVGILAVFVIVFSFITFQFRKKLGNIPSPEVKGKERNKKIRVTNPDKAEPSEKKHHPKVQTRSKQKKSTEPSKPKSSSEDIGLYKKPTREAPKKRVEILNKKIENTSSSKNSSEKDVKFHSIKIESKRTGWN